VWVGMCYVGFTNPIDIVACVQRQRLALAVAPPEDGELIQSPECRFK
jgi:hypothetical protein